MSSSRLSNTTLSFTNAGGQGAVSYSNSGDLEISAPVLAQSITASALVVGSNSTVVASSVFGEISVSALKDVGAIEMDGSTSGTVTVRPAATTASHTLTLPAAQGSADTYLKNNGSGGLTWAAVAGGAGSGDVVGPSSATDNAVARFDETTGKLLQNSGVTISDTADVAGVKTLALSGADSGAMTVQPAAATTSYTVTLPGAQGAAATYLRNDGSGTLSWSSHAGDLVGPASATDNAVARFDATTGKLLQNSGVTISDTSDIAGAKTIALNGSSAGTLTIRPSASTTSYILAMPPEQGLSGTVLRNNGNGGLSWSRTMQPVFYWSRPANGDPRSGQTYNGTFAGDATITGVAVYDGVRLTSANNNLTGSVNWNVTGFDFSRDFALRVHFWQNNTADGIFIGFGGSSAILNSSTANNAVVFQYNTYSVTALNTQFFRNGVAQGTALNFRSGVNYTSAWMTTTIEHRTYGSTKILTVYHGSNNVMENAIESTTFTFGGSYLAVGARTGASNGTHHVNGVTLEYL